MTTDNTNNMMLVLSAFFLPKWAWFKPFFELELDVHIYSWCWTRAQHPKIISYSNSSFSLVIKDPCSMEQSRISQQPTHEWIDVIKTIIKKPNLPYQESQIAYALLSTAYIVISLAFPHPHPARGEQSTNRASLAGVDPLVSGQGDQLIGSSIAFPSPWTGSLNLDAVPSLPCFRFSSSEIVENKKKANANACVDLVMFQSASSFILLVRKNATNFCPFFPL